MDIDSDAVSFLLQALGTGDDAVGVTERERGNKKRLKKGGKRPAVKSRDWILQKKVRPSAPPPLPPAPILTSGDHDMVMTSCVWLAVLSRSGSGSRAEMCGRIPSTRAASGPIPSKCLRKNCFSVPLSADLLLLGLLPGSMEPHVSESNAHSAAYWVSSQGWSGAGVHPYHDGSRTISCT